MKIKAFVLGGVVFGILVQFLSAPAGCAKDLLIPNEFKSVSEAVQAATSAGDRVIITDGGVYSESITVDRSIAIISDPSGASLEGPEGSGVTLRKGAAKVLIQGLVIQNCRTDGIHVDAGHEASVELQLKNTKIANNGGNGVLFKTGGLASFSADERCSFEENQAAGLRFDCVVKAVMTECSLSRNKESAVLITSDGDSTPNQIEIVEIRLESCALSENGGYGIHWDGDHELNLIGRKTVIERNKEDGMRANPDRFENSSVSLSESMIRMNGGAGLLIEEPVRFILDSCSISENDSEGVKFTRDRAKETSLKASSQFVLQDCDVSSNSQYGILLDDDMSLDLTLSGTTVSNNGTSGILFSPSTGYNGRLIVAKSNVNRNRGFGIVTHKPVVLELEGSFVSGNAADGLRIAGDDERYPSDAVVNIKAIKSLFSENAEYGLNLGGAIPINCEMIESSFDNNLWGGARMSVEEGGRMHSAFTDSSFRSNAEDGAYIENPVEAHFNGCDFLDNGKNGMCLELTDTKEKQESEQSAVVALRGATMKNNGRSGLFLNGRISSDVTLDSTMIRGNKMHGIEVNLEWPFSASLQLSETDISDNHQHGVYLNEALALGFMDRPRSGESGPETVSGCGWLTEKCSLYFDSSKASGNGAGMVALGSGQLVGSGDGVYRLNTAEGKQVLPFVRIQAENPLLWSLGESGDMTFAKLEEVSRGDSGNYDFSKAFYQIGRLFMESRGVGYAQLQQTALDHLKDHGDTEASSILLANLFAEGIIDLQRADTRVALADLLSKFPNSPLADSLLTELAMRTLYRRENFADILNLSDAPANSLAKNLIAAISRIGPSDEESFKAAWSRTSEGHEKTCEVSRRSLPHRQILPEPMALYLYARRCQLVATFTGEAAAWHELGRPELGLQMTSLAQRAWLGFYPSNPLVHYPPSELENALQATKEKLGLTQRTVAETALGAGKEMEFPAVTTDSLTARDRIYDKLLYLSDKASFAPDSQSAPSTEQIRRWILQAYLEDISSLFGMGNVASHAFTERIRFLKEQLLPLFSQPDAIEALNWLGGSVEAHPAIPPELALHFHAEIAALYQHYESPAQEIKHLEAIETLAPNSEEAFVSLERLFTLYMDVWKVPDKALEVQRRIADHFSGTDRALQARLNVAKILYEQKEYERAIVELESLGSQIVAAYHNPSIGTLLGLAYLANGDYEDARGAFAEVISRDEGEHREKCLYLMGYSYITEQKYSDALKPFGDLVDLYPDGLYTQKAQSFIDKISQQ